MWDHVLTVFVPGLPAPQGSKRAWIDKRSGKVMMAEQSTRVGPWRTAVKRACAKVPRVDCVDTPVSVWVEFILTRPKTVTRLWPTSKNEGDIDKLLRSTFDGLVKAGVIKDDSLIVDGGQRKRYADPWEEPGANIRIEVLPFEHPQCFEYPVPPSFPF